MRDVAWEDCRHLSFDTPLRPIDEEHRVRIARRGYGTRGDRDGAGYCMCISDRHWGDKEEVDDIL